MASSKSCKYCESEVKENDFEVFTCTSCACFAHTRCTDSDKLPRLKGDNLFIYDCKDCSYEKRDEFTRMKLSWAQVIHITLYNLIITQSGRQGYFRWKEDICEFIDNHWNYLMPDREKTVTWMSTVAGTLSVHSKVFKSGYYVFNEAGWWSLREVTTPKANPDNYKVTITKPYNLETQTFMFSKKDSELSSDYGRGKRQRKGKKKDNLVSPKISKLENGTLTCQIDEDYESNRLKLKVSTSKYISGLDEKICENDLDKNSNSDNTVSDQSVVSAEFKIDSKNKLNADNETSYYNLKQTCIESKSSIQPLGIHLCDGTLKEDKSTVANMQSSSENSSFDAIQSDSFLIAEPALLDGRVNVSSSNMLENENVCSISSKENEMAENEFREVELQNKQTLNKLIPLTIKEETEVLNKINESSIGLLSADSSVRRLRRKLLLRKKKREINFKLFSLQDIAENVLRISAPNDLEISKADTGKKVQFDINTNGEAQLSNRSYHHPALHDINVLDRFMRFHTSGEKSEKHLSVHVRLVGDSDETISFRSIISPYTSRVLKPYIRRDFQALPCKLRLLREIKLRSQDEKSQCTWPIDYCYVQPSHIPAVNALCSDFFWPGIDMTECLQYPEFSCIVLYRKLIIGFAFMVPDVKYNEAYISFILVHPDWQRAGIGSNMIYHLIQTCMGKDITLHVSPTNPSMMLYQKFGFKSEKLIIDFYDKYLPENSSNCNHALLLRLRR